MKSTLKRLILLYPRSWRDRYENEFHALLDDVPPTWRTVVDVLGGAIKMQMTVWNPWQTVAVFGVMGVVAAVVFSLTVPDRFVSTAVIKGGSPQEMSETIRRVESKTFLAGLINEEDLYKRERARMPIEDIVEEMKKYILVRPVQGSGFSVSFQGADAAHAQRVAQRLAAALAESAGGEILDPANLPVRANSPRRSRIVVMGLVGGILAGALIALFIGLKIWNPAAALGLAGAVLCAAASFVVPERFSSSAMLAYRPEDRALVGPTIRAVTSGENLHAMVVRFGLYSNDPHADRRLGEHLHIQELGNARAILIQFDYPDQRVAQRVTQSVVAQMVKENWNFEILDPASFPQEPFSPNRVTAGAVGLMLGFAVAVGLRISKGPVGWVRRTA
jgi:hypothetical protein